VRKLQNTLYVTTPMAYLSLDGETIVIQNGDELLGRIPLLNLENIVSFGYRGASPRLMGACAERGIGLCFLTQNGRFLARVSGPVSGNVLLRTAQYRIAGTEKDALPIAKMFLTGKLFNGRWSLERTLRDHALRVDAERLKEAIGQIRQSQADLMGAGSVEELMGIEGAAAKAYFSVFDQLILKNPAYFCFEGRNRRPPLDPVNALLSFTYSILGHEIAGALESVGLDPAVGFLHALRPGRASLALDLLEELRAPFADRFVLSLINLGTVTERDFARKENGAFYLTDEARKRFLAAWQKRKQEVITHPFLKEKLPWGLVPYAQAMLLSRHIRGDLDAYPPFMWK
jgi:CRISPR-associated protein Cas1